MGEEGNEAKKITNILKGMGPRQTAIKKQLANAETLIKDIEAMDPEFMENKQIKQCEQMANTLEWKNCQLFQRKKKRNLIQNGKNT